MISAEKVYAMLGNESLWEAAQRSHELLADANIAHALAGGVAVCLHGYQRNTVDVDLLIQAGHTETVHDVLQAAGIRWDDDEHEFRTPAEIAIHFLISGEPAGKGSDVRLPDPADPDVVTQRDGLPVLSLAALIESKIASGESNLRGTHKDFADVVELIAKHDLSRDFARHLHKSVRATFRQLVGHARARFEKRIG
jgi:hypothetical protein